MSSFLAGSVEEGYGQKHDLSSEICIGSLEEPVLRNSVDVGGGRGEVGRERDQVKWDSE